ncbi:MAG: hypothetical protein FJ271_16040 [Planctomycetes bacterium]|nr:hypothetical protein [Planctomycetota bacterium]
MGEQAVLAVLGLFAMMGVAGWLLKARRDTPFITLREFWMSRTPEKNCYLRLAGRPGSTRRCARSSASMPRSASRPAAGRCVAPTTLSTWSMDAVPLESMGACQCGYRKNPIFLVLFFAFLLGAFLMFGAAAGPGQQRDRSPLVALGVLSLLVAIVEMIAYWLSKRMEIAVETGGGRLIGVAFKPSLVENATFSRDELEEVMRILVAISGSPG